MHRPLGPTLSVPHGLARRFAPRLPRPAALAAAFGIALRVAAASAFGAAGCGSRERRDPLEGPGSRSRSGSASADGAAASSDSLAVRDLAFAVVGDTRPAVVDDTAGYPVNVIGTLFAAIEARHPAFAIATGDYVFASTGARSQADAQLDLYLQARALYSGPLYAALGNHECTGATASNCGPEGEDGVTRPYAAFIAKLVAPLGPAGAVDLPPYYVVPFEPAASGAPSGKAWTAKVVVLAANAWSAEQGAWLDAVLARSTTYTFVVRHEPAAAETAPGVPPSEEILARHPYTLIFVGHTHTYARYRDRPREVIIGNGGAPLEGKTYGFGWVARRSDGAITVDMLDWRDGRADPDFHFAVDPSGRPL